MDTLINYFMQYDVKYNVIRSIQNNTISYIAYIYCLLTPLQDKHQ